MSDDWSDGEDEPEAKRAKKGESGHSQVFGEVQVFARALAFSEKDVKRQTMAM